MNLTLKQVKWPDFNPEDIWADFLTCDICSGIFIPQGNVHILESDIEYEDDIDVIRFICAGCAGLTPFNFRRALEYRAHSIEQGAWEKESEADDLEQLESRYPGSTDIPNLPGSRRVAIRRNSAKHDREIAKKIHDLLGAETINTAKGADRVASESDGYIYLLGSPDGYCKIGRTKQLSSRLASIGLQLPFKVELIHSIRVSDPVKAERHLHKKFSHCRMNGEWFSLSASDINWIKSLTTLEP